jgi:hypothetical protein
MEASSAFSRSVRGDRPVRRSFSRTSQRNVGARAAIQMTNWPSRKFSGDPESFTSGSISTAGKGGKLMYVLPLNSAKSLFWAYGGGPWARS